MVAFYAFDYSFRALEQASGDAYLVAFEKFLRDFAQRNEVIADGGNEDEIVHLPFRNRRRMFAFRIKIEINLAPILGNQLGCIGHCTPHEDYAGSELGAIAVDAIIGESLGDEGGGADYACSEPGYRIRSGMTWRS